MRYARRHRHGFIFCRRDHATPRTPPHQPRWTQSRTNPAAHSRSMICVPSLIQMTRRRPRDHDALKTRTPSTGRTRRDTHPQAFEYGTRYCRTARRRQRHRDAGRSRANPLTLSRSARRAGLPPFLAVFCARPASARRRHSRASHRSVRSIPSPTPRNFVLREGDAERFAPSDGMRGAGCGVRNRHEWGCAEGTNARRASSRAGNRGLCPEIPRTRARFCRGVATVSCRKHGCTVRCEYVHGARALTKSRLVSIRNCAHPVPRAPIRWLSRRQRDARDGY
ncbi:hypothetical protein C8R45DRAFT_964160 [Mycena sanguinolenta]|nr:hypothetical protein C8R45DRAFT_964160 [Mycena sanguinolenta]